MIAEFKNKIFCLLSKNKISIISALVISAVVGSVYDCRI
nr:MAG TPA: hypothetical protein [Caudoviricetes sp.]